MYGGVLCTVAPCTQPYSVSQLRTPYVCTMTPSIGRVFASDLVTPHPRVHPPRFRPILCTPYALIPATKGGRAPLKREVK